MQSKAIALNLPILEDAIHVHNLIKQCPPLDPNSSYCNALQCSHFADTCVVAKSESEVVGFTSGYIIPTQPDTLFIWQVAVAESARGTGIGTRMIHEILRRPICAPICFIETTVSDDNIASLSLFQKLATHFSTPLHKRPWMDKQTHFLGQHESEPLIRIGPFSPQQ